jgi:hypothetical protein
MLQEADVAALSSRVRLAVLKDAKLDATALSEPIERWMDEPLSGLCLKSLEPAQRQCSLARTGASIDRERPTQATNGPLLAFAGAPSTADAHRGR